MISKLFEKNRGGGGVKDMKKSLKENFLTQTYKKISHMNCKAI